LRQGRYKEALADKERAIRIVFTTGNQEQLASCFNDIAVIKMEIGESSGVIDLFQRSLRLKEALGNRAGCATTGTNIARCYIRGTGTAVDYGKALEWALRANAILGELQYTANLVDNLATISQAYLGLKQHGPALDYADRSQAAAEKQPTPYNRATALAQKGAVLCALGSAEAEPTLREAGLLFHEIGNRHEQASVLLQLAEHVYERGLKNQAREALVAVRDIYLELRRDAALAALIDRYPDLLGGGARPAPAGSAARQSGLRIQVLGPFRIWPAGASQPLAGKQWGSRLGRRIMAYLLTADFSGRGGIDRDKLLDIFWNNADAGGSLRVILHRLRKNLNCHDAVVFADNKYSFNWRLSDIWLDREQMESFCKKGLELGVEKKWGEAWEQLERAEALFAGEYLEGDDEPWMHKTRKTLRTTHRAILEKLIEFSNQTGRPEAAAVYQDKLKIVSS
jgi:tetratricopeptide (TPR) repeat protein